MCTYKGILIFLTIVASIYSYPYPIEDNQRIKANTQNENETHEMTAEELRQSYYEFYKDVSAVKNNAPLIVAAQTYPVDLPRFIPEYHSELFSVPSFQGAGDFTGLSSNINLYFEQPNRHLRSTHNKEEFNQNSLDTNVNSNVRGNTPRERVKNIREHFKKYMEHFIQGGKNVPIRHNFEPYNPKENNMIVLKVQDDNDELASRGYPGSGHKNRNDALKFLHIIEGNELLQNVEDTDYRFQIAFSDTFKH